MALLYLVFGGIYFIISYICRVLMLSPRPVVFNIFEKVITVILFFSCYRVYAMLVLLTCRFKSVLLPFIQSLSQQLLLEE